MEVLEAFAVLGCTPRATREEVAVAFYRLLTPFSPHLSAELGRGYYESRDQSRLQIARNQLETYFKLKQFPMEYELPPALPRPEPTETPEYLWGPNSREAERKRRVKTFLVWSGTTAALLITGLSLLFLS